MTSAIELHGLTKTFRVKTKQPGLLGSVKSLFRPQYKEIKAVESVNLSIGKGELVGFIGPNGAGKSTTLKMLTGILHPSGGEATVLGLTPWHDRKKLAYKIGTVFGQRSQLWLHLPAQDSFDLMAAIYDIEETAYRKRLAQLVKDFNITEFLDQPVRKLSLGQRMRCELVAALLHNPEVLYLDEPSIGLDILAKKALREHIKTINKRGVTVILTSHDMDDIEDLCNRVIIINHGKIISDSSFEELRKKHLNRKRVTVYLNKKASTLKMTGVETLEQTPLVAKLEIDLRKKTVQKVLAKVTSHFDIDDIDVHDPPIEEIIGSIYARKK